MAAGVELPALLQLIQDSGSVNEIPGLMRNITNEPKQPQNDKVFIERVIHLKDYGLGSLKRNAVRLIHKTVFVGFTWLDTHIPKTKLALTCCRSNPPYLFPGIVFEGPLNNKRHLICRLIYYP